MSLREKWYAAREQRENEVRTRQQEVLKNRQQIQTEMAALHDRQRTTLSEFYQNLATETAEFLSTTTARRSAMAAVLRDSLSNFHSTLQANSTAFREKTRSHQQQVWLEQAQQRAAYIAALQDYVWGKTPAPGNVRSATSASSSPPQMAATPVVNSNNVDRVYQYLQQNAGARTSQIETALGLSRVDTVNALQTLTNQMRVVQQDRGYFAVLQESQV